MLLLILSIPVLAFLVVIQMGLYIQSAECRALSTALPAWALWCVDVAEGFFLFGGLATIIGLAAIASLVLVIMRLARTPMPRALQVLKRQGT